MFVTAQGSPYARFRRALATGNGFLAWTAAAELESVNLADSLALCLAIVDTDRPRYDRAALRWHARLCAEAKLTFAEAQLALAALQTLPAAGADALLELCELHGQAAVAVVLEAWIGSRG